MSTMEVKMFTCFSIILITSFQTGQYLAIHIDVNPETYVLTLNDEVVITCTPDDADKVAKEIMLIEIVKDDKPLVVIRRGLQPSFPSGKQTRFLVTGHINKNVSLSYLSLTLERFESSDSGQYSCVMYFVDEIGLVKMEKSSLNLTEERLDIKSVEKFLKVLKDNVKAVLKSNKDLQNKVANQSKEIASLSDKVTSTLAFSATNNHSIINPRSGKILILPDIIMQHGSGYDPNTGVYKAPRDGLYVFHVVVLASMKFRELTRTARSKTEGTWPNVMGRHGNTDRTKTIRTNKRWNYPTWLPRIQGICDYFALDLMANNKVLSKLAITFPIPFDQSSIHSVVDLKAGDRVFSMMKPSHCYGFPYMYTVFTGYLIKAY